MKTSDTINEIAGALAKAQLQMGNASFNKINPHFKSKYADLAAIRDAVIPALAANGIAMAQLTEPGEGVLFVHTRLMHSSGQWIESSYPIINDTMKPQAMGSALTYAKRYSLASICGIASEEDDDGNEATEHGKGTYTGGTPGASKEKNRPEYTRLEAGFRDIARTGSIDDLNAYVRTNAAVINGMPPDWWRNLQREKKEAEAELLGQNERAA